MAKINVLKREVAELIAAGEVVERPASVIKELIENSIDAGATSITVEIINGGSTYMRVTDNGCGIAREDVPLAFVSHATSKVITADDLQNICTFGFRGEALASICAVSKTEMLTCFESESIGTRCSVQGGEVTEIDDAGCPKGTTIVVRDLFYNVPARMKFLKKDITEANAVYGIVENIAISHPEISVRLIKDGRIALQTSGDGKLISVIHSIYGRELAGSLIEVSYELEGIKVRGYIGKPEAARPNRSMQHFFVNGRMVKSIASSRALDEAYKGSIMVGKFPVCVLNIDLNPQLVDVNVHPAKTQVRFVNEKAAFEAVYYAGKTALKVGDTVKHYRHDSMPPDKKESQAAINEFTKNLYRAKTEVQTSFYDTERQKSEPKNNFWQRASSSDIITGLNDNSAKFYIGSYKNKESFDSKPQEGYTVPVIVYTDETYEHEEQSANSETKNVVISSVTAKNGAESECNCCKADTLYSENTSVDTDEKAVAQAENTVGAFDDAEEKSRPENKKTVPEFRVIGEAFKTYIIVELDRELLLIDKHACHERMIYERLKENLSAPEGQILLQPISVTLSREEYSAAVQNIESINALGFEVEDFGENTLLVRQVPVLLQDENIESTISEIAGYLSRNKRELETKKMDWMLHSAACRAAVKAGDFTSKYEMEIFVAELLGRDDIRYCPHGRPVCVSMSEREIEKNFGRV